MDLRGLIRIQTQDQRWGTYSQQLLTSNFKEPRKGRNNDQAHPPIHPVNYVAPSALESDEHRRVYEFVVRRFLGCCSDDAKGETTTVELLYGDETFFTNGLTVLERNYLDVYTYDKWTSSQALPQFQLNETFEPTEATITEGQTTAPGYLTEPELISLMDANSIGTDATMAEHIAKIKEREYVITRPRGTHSNASTDVPNSRTTTTSRRGGRGGARGGNNNSSSNGRAANNNNSTSAQQEFIPTTLGVALIEGYDSLGLEISLGKPFLRKEMEANMSEICAGRKSRTDVVEETLAQYRDVFIRCQRQVGTLQAVSLSWLSLGCSSKSFLPYVIVIRKFQN